jgi:hypothetical protein
MELFVKTYQHEINDQWKNGEEKTSHPEYNSMSPAIISQKRRKREESNNKPQISKLLTTIK